MRREIWRCLLAPCAPSMGVEGEGRRHRLVSVDEAQLGGGSTTCHSRTSKRSEKPFTPTRRGCARSKPASAVRQGSAARKERP